MATHIQVVLRDDVENLGKSGELVRVRPGYARNFLIPRGLAVPATRGNIARVEHAQAAAVARAAKAKADASSLAKAYAGLTVTIAMQAGEGEKLFGSVGTRDIADALAKAGHTIDRKKIVLADNIKTLGEHSVTLKLGYEVSATIKVVVARADG